MKNSNDLKENILNKENLMSLDISREKVEKTIIKGIEYKQKKIVMKRNIFYNIEYNVYMHNPFFQIYF